MACEYICDGCGKRAPAARAAVGWTKPSHWFQRQDSDGVQDACSRACIEKAAKRTGKSSAVLPI